MIVLLDTSSSMGDKIGIVHDAASGFLKTLRAGDRGAVVGFADSVSILQPLTGGASQINIYGAIEGQSVYRPNALTGDPNHLGIMLIVPLLVLSPLYLRLEPERVRLRRGLAATIAFLLGPGAADGADE